MYQLHRKGYGQKAKDPEPETEIFDPESRRSRTLEVSEYRLSINFLIAMGFLLAAPERITFKLVAFNMAAHCDNDN